VDEVAVEKCKQCLRDARKENARVVKTDVRKARKENARVVKTDVRNARKKNARVVNTDVRNARKKNARVVKTDASRAKNTVLTKERLSLGLVKQVPVRVVKTEASRAWSTALSKERLSAGLVKRAPVTKGLRNSRKKNGLVAKTEASRPKSIVISRKEHEKTGRKEEKSEKINKLETTGTMNRMHPRMAEESIDARLGLDQRDTEATALSSSAPPLPRAASKVIETLNPNDVLLGRGSGPNDWIGNVTFRQYIEGHKEAYFAGRKYDKTRIAYQIFHNIQSAGGHFLRRPDTWKGRTEAVPVTKGVWVEVEEEIAVEKCKQCLRAPSIKNGWVTKTEASRAQSIAILRNEHEKTRRREEEQRERINELDAVLGLSMMASRVDQDSRTTACT